MFEDVLGKYKDEIVEALVACGEANRVYKILSDIEMNREVYLHFYEEGRKDKGGVFKEAISQETLAQESLTKPKSVLQKYVDKIYCPSPDDWI